MRYMAFAVEAQLMRGGFPRLPASRERSLKTSLGWMAGQPERVRCHHRYIRGALHTGREACLKRGSVGRIG